MPEKVSEAALYAAATTETTTTGQTAPSAPDPTQSKVEAYKSGDLVILRIRQKDGEEAAVWLTKDRAQALAQAILKCL